MRKKIGTACILLGTLCLLASVGFVFRNRAEAESARESSQRLLQEVHQTIAKATAAEQTPQPAEPTPDRQTEELPAAQPVPYEYAGVLSIPVLGLELPVLDDWTYEKLQLAPCRYFGSCEDEDLVIAAHNFPFHFGGLSQLQPGDAVLFTDMNGTVHDYQVALRETLAPTAGLEMITSGFPLSLYTCTPGGGSRVTVRCTIYNS